MKEKNGGKEPTNEQMEEYINNEIANFLKNKPVKIDSKDN